MTDSNSSASGIEFSQQEEQVLDPRIEAARRSQILRKEQDEKRAEELWQKQLMGGFRNQVPQKLLYGVSKPTGERQNRTPGNEYQRVINNQVRNLSKKLKSFIFAKLNNGQVSGELLHKYVEDSYFRAYVDHMYNAN
jgi:hypothetical protein